MEVFFPPRRKKKAELGQSKVISNENTMQDLQMDYKNSFNKQDLLMFLLV